MAHISKAARAHGVAWGPLSSPSEEAIRSEDESVKSNKGKTSAGIWDLGELRAETTIFWSIEEAI